MPNISGVVRRQLWPSRQLCAGLPPDPEVLSVSFGHSTCDIGMVGLTISLMRYVLGLGFGLEAMPFA